MEREGKPHVMAPAPHFGREHPGDIGQAAYFDERRGFCGEKKHLQGFWISFGHSALPEPFPSYYSRSTLPAPSSGYA